MDYGIVPYVSRFIGGIATALYQLMKTYQVTSILTDTAGRKDLRHIRLTIKETFIRYVGSNYASDYDRLGDWVLR